MGRLGQKTDITELVLTAYNSFVNAFKNTMFSQQVCTSAML
jgi:hypothetical protein